MFRFLDNDRIPNSFWVSKNLMGAAIISSDDSVMVNKRERKEKEVCVRVFRKI